jgi:hypothetical protein
MTIMEGDRRWSVESKEFEVLIRGGDSGVRIYERSTKIKSSIFIRRDELAWLLEALEEVTEGKTSKVFWDQSRAGDPRCIIQKCSNRHGRFLKIEEFDGRRKNGIILIPEGRFGLGWARLTVELDRANATLREGRGLKGGRETTVSKEAKVAPVGRRNTDVMGLLSQPEENQLQVTETIKDKVGGKRPVTYAQAVECGARKAPTKTIIQSKSSHLEMEGCKQMKGATTGEVDAGKERAPAITTQVEAPVGVACPWLQEAQKSLDRDVSLTSINAKQELSSIRVWLGRLRGEVEAGIVRLDVALRNLNASGSGQGSRGASWIPKPKKTFKPSNRYWARKQNWACKKTGGNSGIDPIQREASTIERPKMEDKLNGAVPNDEPNPEGSMVVVSCLESPRRHSTTISSVKQEGDQVTAAEGHGAMGLSRSESTGKHGANGGIGRGSGHSVDGLGLMEEEGGTSFVEVAEDAVCRESAEDGAAPERGSGGSGENTGVLGLSVELPTGSCSTMKRGKEVNRSLSGPGYTGDMESGPGSEPKRKTDYLRKESKPKWMLLSNSGERRSPSEAIVRLIDDPAPEWAQIVPPATHRYGSVEQAPKIEPEEGMLPAGQYRGGSSPELEQSETLAISRSGHAGQASDGDLGKVSSLSLGKAPPVTPGVGGGMWPKVSQLGDLPGILGTFVNMVGGEKRGVVTPIDEVDQAVILRVTQDLLAVKEDSPVAKELKFTLDVSGIAGLSCDRQEMKLAGILGQIIAKKYGKEGEDLSGLNEEHKQQGRGYNVFYDA